MTHINTSQVLFPTLGESDIKRRSEAERRLPTWLSAPIQFSAANLLTSAQNIDDFTDFIDQELINHIKVNMTFTKLFPVQKCLIPALAKQFKSRAFRRPNDICVSSPTGSGKTLAFAIPIVNYLKQSLARELRAVVVLPSRDLAKQVYKTFSDLIRPTHLRCGLAEGDPQDYGFIRKLPKYDAQDKECRPNQTLSSVFIPEYADVDISSEQEHVSTIDILITTPGVLVDMLQNLAGSIFKNLEILVIDEADRLMINHKHDWLNTLEKAVCREAYQCPCMNPNYLDEEGMDDVIHNSTFFLANGCTLKHSARSKSLHKLLFSATLSSDPQILTHLNLFQPRLYLATRPSLTGTKIRNSLGSHTSTPGGSPLPCTMNQTPTTVSTKSELLAETAIPEELEEKMFITETKDKLYVMWYILHELKYRKVLCFTNEKRKCNELTMFINEIAGVSAASFSSKITQEAREKYIQEFVEGKIDVIVSTDMLARGIHVEGVQYVISYDMPHSGTWYAHRAGRTARAGKMGTAITLVDSKQLVQFKKIVQVAHKMPNSMRLSDVVEEMKMPHFSQKDDKRDSYLRTYENYRDKYDCQRAKDDKFRT